MRAACLLFALSVPAALAQAPTEPALRFDRLHSGNGLSHNSVYAITQDREGFLWFGTVDGLNRYDGYEFVTYRHDSADRTSLSNSLVHALYEDREGRLWAGTAQGIDRLDRRAGHFVRYAVPASTSAAQFVVAFAEDSEGTLWAAGGGGLFKFDSALDRFERASEWRDGLSAIDLRVDSVGHLWVLATSTSEAEGSLIRLESDGSPAQTLALDPAWGRIERFEFDAQGRPWLNERGPGIRNGTSLRPSHPERPATAAQLERDPSGTLWVGTTDGRGFCRADGEALACQPLDRDNPTWLHTYVRSILRDRAGSLWVGTYSGVYQHAVYRKPFELRRHDAHEMRSLSANAVSAVARGADGALWVATFGAGLNRVDDAGRVRRYRHRASDASSLPNDVVWHLLIDDEDRLWVATSGGLAQYDVGTDAFRTVSIPRPAGARHLDTDVTFLASDPAGGTWVGSFGGLFHVGPGANPPRHYPATEDARGLRFPGVTALWADDAETLWIVGERGHLSRLDVPKGQFSHFAPHVGNEGPIESETAYDVRRVADGYLWVATGSGLYRFDERAETFQHIGLAEGLPGAVVYSIAEDREGALWLGTNRGLARFNPADGQVRAYDLSDGIGSVEFNRHATFRDADGTLYFGGVDGLLSFQPDAIRDNPFIPPVVLTRVETSRREGVVSLDPATIDALTLTHLDDAVTFEFAALNFTDPHKNRYAYRLEGFDGDWVEAGTQRTARYTNLPSGRYVFRVRGSNNDGVWNTEGAALAVTVLPPFWQTAWFRLLLVAAFIGMLYTAYRVRVGRLLEVERLRLRIAGDLHDDLATDLSGIALATDVLLRRLVLADTDRSRLAEVRNTALEMVEGLRAIVWTINPQHDTMEAMVRRMRQVAERLLGGIDYTFETAMPENDRAIAMTFRRDILLLYKEALHNVVRHADASTVGIYLGQQNGQLELKIEDDGKGFDPNGQSEGNGLASMRARAATLGAEFEVTSNLEEGTLVHLTLRVP